MRPDHIHLKHRYEFRTRGADGQIRSVPVSKAQYEGLVKSLTCETRIAAGLNATSIHGIELLETVTLDVTGSEKTVTLEPEEYAVLELLLGADRPLRLLELAPKLHRSAAETRNLITAVNGMVSAMFQRQLIRETQEGYSLFKIFYDTSWLAFELPEDGELVRYRGHEFQLTAKQMRLLKFLRNFGVDYAAPYELRREFGLNEPLSDTAKNLNRRALEAAGAELI